MYETMNLTDSQPEMLTKPADVTDLMGKGWALVQHLPGDPRKRTFYSLQNFKLKTLPMIAVHGSAVNHLQKKQALKRYGVWGRYADGTPHRIIYVLQK